MYVVGVKGPSVLALHRPFDLARGDRSIDCLHDIHIGVGKNPLRFWVDKEHKRKEFSVFDQVCECACNYV